MIKLSLLIIIILFTGLFLSCECVTDINTPKVVEPTEFADVLLVNAIPDIDSVNLLSSDRLIANSLKYDDLTFNYIKIASGINSFRLTNSFDSSVVFNSMVILEKDTNYSAFAYGTQSRINLLLLKDGINPAQSNISYVRFIHLSPDADSVVFSFDNFSFNLKLAYKSYSPFIPISPGVFNLRVKSTFTGAELLESDSLNLEAGYKYTVLLKGYYNPPHKNKLGYNIIKIPL